jgi:phosphoglycerate dehydrogenase-like enzyme
MAGERLVAVSYQADADFAVVNAEVLDGAAEIIYTSELDGAGRAAAVRRADALLVYELPKELPAGALRDHGKLGFVQFLSTGVDSVDFSELPDTLTVACNAGAYAGAVSEHAVAMTLSLAKRLPQRHAALADGRFEKWSPAMTLDGATCVILGFGGIGTTTARFLRAFGARIWAVTRTGQATGPADATAAIADLDRVLPAADVLIIALPLTAATRGLIGARELALMKPGAILVNVARGPVIDQAALYEHLRTHPEFGAGIDTWWAEPAGDAPFRTDYPFLALPNVLGSPHNSSIITGAMTSAARLAAMNVRRYLLGEQVTGVIRRSDYRSHVSRPSSRRRPSG